MAQLSRILPSLLYRFSRSVARHVNNRDDFDVVAGYAIDDDIWQPTDDQLMGSCDLTSPSCPWKYRKLGNGPEQARNDVLRSCLAVTSNEIPDGRDVVNRRWMKANPLQTSMLKWLTISSNGIIGSVDVRRRSTSLT